MCGASRFSRMRAALLIASLAGLAAPAVADAATWSTPQDLSPPHTFVDEPRLVTWPSGVALASWSWGDGTGAGGRSGVEAAARGRGRDAFSPRRPLVRGRRSDRRTESIAGPVAYGRERTLVATSRPLDARPGERRVRLIAHFARAGGGRERRRRVRTAAGIGSVALAGNDRGAAAVAWFEDRGVRTDRVYVALRRAGGRFGTPRLLARGRIRGVSVAVGAGGDVLVAWDARGVLRTRFKPRTRRGFRATDTIRSEEAFFADLHPVVTASGRAVLAWSAQFMSEGGGSRDVYVQAALRPPRAARFRPAQVLERLGGERIERPIDAVVGPLDRVVVAWSGSDGATRRVRAAAEGPAERFGPALDVSPPSEDALLSDLAAGADGRVIAVWDQGIAAPGTVRAALSPFAGAPFGPPEDASPAGQDARFGHAAFDPLSSRPTIVWSDRPEGSPTVAQAATRSE